MRFHLHFTNPALKGAATVDTAGRLRCFDLYDDLEGEERGREQLALAASSASSPNSKDSSSSKDPKDPSASSKRGPCKRVQEIVTASGVTCLHDAETKVQSYSPKQGRKDATSISFLVVEFPWRLCLANLYVERWLRDPASWRPLASGVSSRNLELTFLPHLIYVNLTFFVFAQLGPNH